MLRVSIDYLIYATQKVSKCYLTLFNRKRENRAAATLYRIFQKDRCVVVQSYQRIHEGIKIAVYLESLHVEESKN